MFSADIGFYKIGTITWSLLESFIGSMSCWLTSYIDRSSFAGAPIRQGDLFIGPRAHYRTRGDAGLP